MLDAAASSASVCGGTTSAACGWPFLGPALRQTDNRTLIVAAAASSWRLAEDIRLLQKTHRPRRAAEKNLVQNQKRGFIFIAAFLRSTLTARPQLFCFAAMSDLQAKRDAAIAKREADRK